MSSKYLLEDLSGGYLLEDLSGFYILEAAATQDIALGVASVTEQAAAMIAVPGTATILLSLASVRDSTFSVVAVPGTATRTTSLASEADSSLSIVVVPGAVTRAAGLAGSLDAALSLVVVPGAVTQSIGLADTRDTAYPPTVFQGVTISLGLADERDTATATTASPGPVTLSTGLASTTESAFAVTSIAGTLTRALGLGSEADTSYTMAVSSIFIVVLGLSSSRDAAQAMTAVPGVRAVSTGVAQESDQSFSMTAVPGVRTVTLGLGQEQDSSFSLTVVPGPRTLSIGIASELDSAFLTEVSLNAFINLGPAEELDSSFSIIAVPGTRTVSIGVSQEAETAYAATPVSTTVVTMGLADTRDQARAISAVPGAFSVVTGLASIRDSAFGLTVVPGGRTVSTGIAVFVHSSFGIVAFPGTATISLSVAPERDSSFVIAFSGNTAVALNVAVEEDLSVSIDAIPGVVQRILGESAELNSAFLPGVLVGTAFISIGRSEELGSAFSVSALAGGVSRELLSAFEVQAAYTIQPVPGTVSVEMFSANEIDSAILLTIAFDQTISLGTSSEINFAEPVFVLLSGLGYREVFPGMLADHYWALTGSAIDFINNADGVGEGSVLFNASPIAEDAAFSVRVGSDADRISFPERADISGAPQQRRAVGGWFMTDSVSDLPRRIYGEGHGTPNFSMLLAWNNHPVLEVRDGTFAIQVFSETRLKPLRPYHLLGTFEGSQSGNEIKLFIDGVKQQSSSPSPASPGVTVLSTRLPVELGAPSSNVSLGGQLFPLLPAVNAYYNHWATWNGAPAQMSDEEIRVELFEKGALADITIQTDSPGNMQTQVDLLAGTTRQDSPCCLAVEPVLGGGNFSIRLLDVLFDPDASLHVRYNGNSGVLTVRNAGTSNASRASAPFGGSIRIVTETTVRVTALDVETLLPIQGARVYLIENGGPIVLNGVTDSSGRISTTYDHFSDVTFTARARKEAVSPLYSSELTEGTLTADGLDLTILMYRED